MGAYEDVRDDVIRQHEHALARAEAARHQEGLGESLSVPTVNVSGSQPAWLGVGWRQILTLAALAGTAVGLWMLATLSEESAVTAGFSGSFAVISLIVAYFTVAGFGTAAFSIGSGADGSGESGEKDGGNDTKAAARR